MLHKWAYIIFAIVHNVLHLSLGANTNDAFINHYMCSVSMLFVALRYINPAKRSCRPWRIHTHSTVHIYVLYTWSYLYITLLAIVNPLQTNFALWVLWSGILSAFVCEISYHLTLFISSPPFYSERCILVKFIISVTAIFPGGITGATTDFLVISKIPSLLSL
jgi:hypothetical protein